MATLCSARYKHIRSFTSVGGRPPHLGAYTLCFHWCRLMRTLFGSCSPCRNMLSVPTTCSLHVLLLIHLSALCVSVQHQGLRIWQFAPAFKINLNLKNLLSITSYQKIDKNLKDIEAKHILKWLGTMPGADLSTMTSPAQKMLLASEGPKQAPPVSFHHLSMLGVLCRGSEADTVWCAYLSDIQREKYTIRCASGIPSLEMQNDYRAECIPVRGPPSTPGTHTYTYAPTAEHPPKIPRKHPNTISYISAACLLPAILGQRNNLIHVCDSRASTMPSKWFMYVLHECEEEHGGPKLKQSTVSLLG